MAAAAAVVVSASLVTERAGPFLGAMIVTLPVSAGPIYVILAVDHGAGFIAAAALVSLASNSATAVFTVVYALAAQRWSTAVSLGLAALSWGAAAAIISLRHWTLVEALALNVALFIPAIAITWRLRRAAFAGPVQRRWYDVPARGLGVALLTGTVTLVSWQLGPAATGFFAVYPIVFTSLIVILHPRIGGPATAATLVNGLRGLVGFAGALSTLHLMATPFGSAIGLGAALAVSVGWNTVLLLNARRTRAAKAT
jgi:hypothetical protein